jgi:hypothetical protein
MKQKSQLDNICRSPILSTTAILKYSLLRDYFHLVLVPQKNFFDPMIIQFNTLNCRKVFLSTWNWTFHLISHSKAINLLGVLIPYMLQFGWCAKYNSFNWVAGISLISWTIRFSQNLTFKIWGLQKESAVNCLCHIIFKSAMQEILNFSKRGNGTYRIHPICVMC